MKKVTPIEFELPLEIDLIVSAEFVAGTSEEPSDVSYKVMLNDLDLTPYLTEHQHKLVTQAMHDVLTEE